MDLSLHTSSCEVDRDAPAVCKVVNDHPLGTGLPAQAAVASRSERTMPAGTAGDGRLLPFRLIEAERFQHALAPRVSAAKIVLSRWLSCTPQ